VKQLEIGNADVVNLGARGHKTGGCYARYQPFSSIKPGTRRAGRFQNPLIWIIGTFIKEGWKIVTNKKVGKGFSNWWLVEKRSAFFRQGMLRKMYGCKAAREEETEKDSSKIKVPVIFVKGNYFGTPLYTMCRINKGDDKRWLWEQGVELVGGGGEGQIRGAKG
jgi:hypothetical protein